MHGQKNIKLKEFVSNVGKHAKCGRDVCMIFCKKKKEIQISGF